MTAKGKIILITVVLLSAGALAFALNIKTIFRQRNTPVKAKADKEIVYDTVLLKRFTDLLQTLDFNKSNFSYAGTFNITDGKDSLANIRNLPFLFCRNKKIFYSRIGNNEVVNDDGVNIYIENDNKKVVVSKGEFRLNTALTNMKQVVDKARSEKYELISTAQGTAGKLSLLNEHHVACKELSVTYDTLTKKLNSVLLRYSDIADPSNKKRDRKVEIDIAQVEAIARKHPGIKDIVKEERGKITLSPKYSGYELITL